MNTSGNRVKCICQICTCGRHRCPHTRSITHFKEPQTCALAGTEYDAVYKRWAGIKPRAPIRPVEHSRLSATQMDTLTTYGGNYVQHPLQARRITPKQIYNKPMSDMDSETTYKKYYTDTKGCLPRNSKRPRQTRFTIHGSGIGSLPQTETQHRFQPVSSDQMKACRQAPVEHKECLQVCRCPQDGITTVQADYIRHPTHPRTEQIRPKEEVHVGGRFDDNTTYGVEYYTKHLQTPALVAAVPYIPNKNRFFGETTVMADYKGLQSLKRDSFKPLAKYEKTGQPFTDQTNYNDNYKDTQGHHRPDLCFQQNKYIPPQEKMDLSTHYKEHYKNFHNFKRVGAILPKTDNRDTAAFQGCTCYQDDYRQRPTGLPPKNFKVEMFYEPPTEKLEDTSIQKLHYNGAYAPPAELCKPRLNSRGEIRPDMMFNTMYKDMYQGEQNSLCPALRMTRPKPALPKGNVTFVKNGHQYYDAQ